MTELRALCAIQECDPDAPVDVVGYDDAGQPIAKRRITYHEPGDILRVDWTNERIDRLVEKGAVTRDLTFIDPRWN